MPGNYLLVEHKDLPAHPEVVVSCGTRTGQPLQSLPSYGHHRSCDWYLDSRLGKLTYLGKCNTRDAMYLFVQEW